MRRGRLTLLVGALLASLLAAAVAAPGAAAADPKQICADLADNGRLDGNYTQEELAAAAASVQGYCTFVVIQTPPPPAPCTEVAAGTPGAVQAPNGKWYINAPGGNAAVCGPAPQAPAPCTEVAAGTPGAVQAPNGKWYVNVPAGGAEVCGPAATIVTPPPPPAPPAQPVGGVLPQQKSVAKPKAQPKAQAAKPQPQAGVAGEQSPLRETRTTGTLPFTGAELAIFAIVGAALIGGGILLRVSSRHGSDAL